MVGVVVSDVAVMMVDVVVKVESLTAGQVMVAFHVQFQGLVMAIDVVVREVCLSSSNQVGC